MKKTFAIVLAVCLTAAMSFAGENKDAKKQTTVTGIVTDAACAKSGDKAKMMDEACAKKCAENGKVAFVNDADGSVWAITNGEAVKGHEGHHVTLKGHANATDKTFHVMSAKMADKKGEKKQAKKSM